jgi:hypothetical protein
VAGAEASVYSFSPIDADEARGIAGSGTEPCLFLDVPYGSRVAASNESCEPILYVSGEVRAITAEQAVQRFAT